MAKGPELELILEWVGPGKGPDAYQLWACRGERKGCKKRVLKTKRHCADCVLPNLDDTVGEVMKRLKRGDA
jgi:hypothetical protein